jgi:hypothetical protein
MVTLRRTPAPGRAVNGLCATDREQSSARSAAVGAEPTAIVTHAAAFARAKWAGVGRIAARSSSRHAASRLRLQTSRNLATALCPCAPRCAGSRRSRASASPSACATGMRCVHLALTAACSPGKSRLEVELASAKARRTWRRVTASTPTCRASRRRPAPRHTRGCPRRRALGWSALRPMPPKARPPAARPSRAAACSTHMAPAAPGTRRAPWTQSGAPRPRAA